MQSRFIYILTSNTIRQRLPEKTSNELQAVFNQSSALEMAQKNLESCLPPPFINSSSAKTDHHQQEKLGNFQTQRCYFCGNSEHA